MIEFLSDYISFLSSEPLIFYSIVFLLGICVGSFLNVCVYRLPDETKSVVKPSSYCPICQRGIKWFDNIPILSYLLLRGKCRSCNARISPRYVFVEIVTGGMFVYFAHHFGVTIEFIFYLYLACSLLVATLVDFEHQIIPDEVTFLGMLFALLVSYYFPQVQGEEITRLGIANSIIGLLVGGGIIYGLAIMGDIIFRKESMGGGDIKLLAMIGAFLGWKMAILTLALSPYFAIFTALYYKFRKKESVIPFGPFLSIAAIVGLFFGQKILGFLGLYI